MLVLLEAAPLPVPLVAVAAGLHAPLCRDEVDALLRRLLTLLPDEDERAPAVGGWPVATGALLF